MTTLKTVTKTAENLDEYSLVDVFRACYPEKSADEIDCLIANINELCINHEIDFDAANFIYRLLKLTPKVISPLTGEPYHAFITQMNGIDFAVAKLKAEEKSDV